MVLSYYVLENVRRKAPDSGVSEEERRVREEQYRDLGSRHGGYWRYGFVDHAYLYNLYFPPQRFFEVLKNQVHELVLNYPVAQSEVAAWVGDLISQPAERIVVGNGAAEIIKILSSRVAEKLIVPVPSFNEYANAAPSGKVVEFPLDADSFELDVDRFAEEAKRVNADVAVVVTPNNPTSLLVPKSELVRLLGHLEGFGCMLVVDESFVDFAVSPEEETLEPCITQYSNLAILKSMSKAYGICGLRIGYLLTANREFAKKIKEGLHIWNLNGFAETFLKEAPGYREEFSDSCRRLRADRDEFYRELCQLPGLVVFRPDANFIFCRLPDGAPSGPEVAKRLFVEHHIYIKHCAGKTMPESDRYLRIASRTPDENTTLVNALREILL